MEDLKQKTLVLKRDKPRFADELRNGPVQPKIDFQYAIKEYGDKYMDALKTVCMEHRDERKIFGYIEFWHNPYDFGVNYLEKLPCTDPKEIQRSKQKYKDDFSGFPKYHYPLLHPKVGNDPLDGIALPYQDSVFVNGLIKHLENELYDEGFSYVSIKPEVHDKVKLVGKYKKSFLHDPSGKPGIYYTNSFNHPVEFDAVKEGKCTVLKFLISW